MAHRPERIRIANELGRPQTLASGPDQFERVGSGPETLFLGLGPDPAVAATLAAPDAPVLWVECPEFRGRMGPGWAEAVPPQWREVFPADLDPGLLRRCTVWYPRQNPRLFPSFWGPLLAMAQWAHLAPPAPLDKSRVVFLPAGESDLLVWELGLAMEQAGFTVRRLHPDTMAAELPQALAECRPALFLCVNFRGLDPYGERFHLLRQAGVPVAAWCVDNPWHLLSGLKAPFWRQAHLFVTDASFLAPLREHGGVSVHHLPLAAAPGLFESRKDTRDWEISDRLVFVGRSAFPDKAGFFSGLRLDEALMARARARLDRGERPDFAWWAGELGIRELWPGNEARRAGLGAEETGLAWRALCLARACRDMDVTVFGDEAWRELVPGLKDLRGPVDYYGPLPDVYRQADICLNLTSPLLPAGLTQRHFDVWAAGGFLVTDATPGLDIFPRELVRDITFRGPDELAAVVGRLHAEPGLMRDLHRAWRSAILAGHTYDHRFRAVLDAVSIN